MLRRILISLSICIAAAVLETLCAGTNVAQRFDELALPAFALPMWCWAVIGVYYYAMCFVVLYRIFLKTPETRFRSLAFSLVISLMIGNALWNLAFFQPGYLLVTFAITIPYALLAFSMFLVLWRFDRPTMGFVVPYLVYLIYVTAWTYAVWQLNGSA